jgi:hypothetical protein
VLQPEQPQPEQPFAPLALNESFGGFALRIERIEFLFESFLGRFPRVDRTAQWCWGWLRNLLAPGRFPLVNFPH